MNNTTKQLIKYIRSQPMFFDKKQENNICRIIELIGEKLTGKIADWTSGSTFSHIAVQMTDNRWLMFHNVSEDVTLSTRPYKTERSISRAFGEFEEYACGLCYKQHGDNFAHPEKIAKDILTGNTINAYED